MQARLLLNALAYNLVHATRTLLEQAAGGKGLGRASRTSVQGPAARILVDSRRIILAIHQQAAGYWHDLWSMLRALRGR